jgi:S1-C subfamily serine protease
MKQIGVIIFILLNFHAQCLSQEKSSELFNETFFALKQNITNWSCAGAFLVTLSTHDGILVIKSNTPLSYKKTPGLIEYFLYQIDLKTIKSISVEQNDKGCAGINIRTNHGGTVYLMKENWNNYEENITEIYTKSNGYLTSEIRIKKNDLFEDRCRQIINAITAMAVFHGNDIIDYHNKGKAVNPSSGTGFALSSGGLIATNHHVVEGASSIMVKGVKGDFSKSYNAKVVLDDERNDLAIIQIEDDQFTTLGDIPFGIGQGFLSVGEDVNALGYPMRGSMGDEIKLTNGIISSLSGFQGDITTYQISVPVQPGNSGGPLFDSKGMVAGIISSKHTKAENASYAIKVSYLNNLIQMLDSKSSVSRVSKNQNRALPEQVKYSKEFVYIIEVQ